MPRGVHPSHVENVWSPASVQYRVSWYEHASIPSANTGKLVVSFCEKAYQTKAVVLVRNKISRIPVVESFLLFRVMERHFHKGTRERVASERPKVPFWTRTRLGRDRLWCSLTSASFLYCRCEQWLYLSRMTGYLDSGVANGDAPLVGFGSFFSVSA